MSIIDDPNITALSRFLDVNVFRSELVMSNMANIDTPGYRTQDVNFKQEMERASGNMEYASFTPAAHQVRGLMERPDGNNVSVERESLLLAETQMKFNLGVQLLKDQFHMISMAINSGGGTTS